ncbi:ABC transporter transmembrane domain-containing protein [Spirochaeta isovalerica]|uniref:Multidrug resistance-like ATP-binding protein MdlA n=1 Tax=Spirochaeta isovalerica TaxID=150 RepID=A0A841R821_9SPIO|nr:ATP-binding cassette subfamily B protein [Spirochaeta isovalerica]
MLNEYKTVTPYVKKYWYNYVLGLAFLFLTNAGQLLIPQVLRQSVDVIYNGGSSDGLILRNTLLIIGLAVLVALGRFFWRFFIHGASRRIEAALRRRLFDHLLLLGHNFFNKHKTGDIMARATNDLNHIRMATGMALIAFADGLFMSMAILIILFRQNVSLAGLTILPLPIITLIILFFGRMIGPLFRKVQNRFSALSGHVQEALTGVRVIKAFNREDFFAREFEEKNDDYRDANMSLVKIWGLYFPIIAFLSGISTVLLLIFGGQAVISGSFSPGDFTAFLSYLGMLVWPLLGAGFTVNMIQRGGASLKRINEILDFEPLIRNVEEPIERIRSSEISVNNLTYTHEGEDEPVLEDISFNLKEGEILGILGRTGSGKSTLLNLLTRQYDPPEWSILLDGVDVRMYEINALRRYFGLVPQENFLFSTTIEENISFGIPEADHEAVLAAAQLSTIDRDVEAFPRKWETEVGERGVTLSGGQKQRVAISRALILDPPVLVFDDALSAVDTETESKILKHLLQERAGKTSIVVSHRISTLQYADKVIVLDKGKIVESGTPGELLGNDGIYSDIARLQNFEASEEN